MATPTGVVVTGAVAGYPATVTDFIGPLAAPVLGAVQNPNRLFLLVMFSTATGRVMPAPGSLAFGLGPDVGGAAGGRLIHKASFPGLIIGEWFVYDPGGGSVRVYDVECDNPPCPGE